MNPKHLVDRPEHIDPPYPALKIGVFKADIPADIDPPSKISGLVFRSILTPRWLLFF